MPTGRKKNKQKKKKNRSQQIANRMRSRMN